MTSVAPAAVHALIPIKRFDRGKTRLRERLGEEHRRELARRMFERVLETCLACPRLSGTLVLTDADEIAAYARAKGASVLADPIDFTAGPARLAQVVDAGLAELRARAVPRALVLMADLPELEARDLDDMLDALETFEVVLAPDRRGRCTNALGLQLQAGAGLRTAFGGPDSLADHAAQAHGLGLRVSVRSNPRLALDVDVPADLDLVSGLHQD
jgi:2-phospho-L-lactate guanylyltransferase